MIKYFAKTITINAYAYEVTGHIEYSSSYSGVEIDDAIIISINDTSPSIFPINIQNRLTERAIELVDFYAPDYGGVDDQISEK